MKHSRYETLLAFCEAMSWAINPETVYQQFVDISVEYFECDVAHLHLLDLDGKTFQHLAFHDEQVDPGHYTKSLTISVGRMSLLVESHDLIVMEDYAHPHAEDEIPQVAVDAGFQSAISIPLCSSSGVLGMLSIVYKRALPWKEEDHEFLLQVGSVLGTFIQRMQMQKKELELRVLRERKELSSEIHDNVSQMVSALAIHVDIAQDCLESQDLPALNEKLQVIGDQARKITKVLREEMLSLRTPIESSDSMVTDLEEVLARFQAQWNIAVRLVNHGDTPPVLSQYARLQLVRIVNESLQNVLRHARAHNVEVHISRRNGHALIDIIDDGIGFDVDEVPPERLGIRIMRERAESAEGRLFVQSNCHGSTVRVELPVIRS